jgi:hypothetical protein
MTDDIASDKFIPRLIIAHRRRTGERRYSSTPTKSRHWMEVTFQIHVQAALSPGEEPRLRNGQEGWVGPRFGLDAVEKIKISRLYWHSPIPS